MTLKNSFCKLGLLVAFIFGFVSSTVSAQTPGEGRMPDMRLPGVSFPAGKSFVEVPFEVEGNWMVIPVSVNNSRPLRFVLDSGASGTILYASNAADSLNLKITGTMPVRGAGGGGVVSEVRIAENVGFNIGGIEFSGARLALRNLPSGSPLQHGRNGVIGRIVFATLVVEVDWEKSVMKLHDPAKYKYSGLGAVLPLTFDEGGRPYTTATVSVSGGSKVPVKLVVDTGGSHVLSLDVGSKPEITLPEGATKTVLGRGGSGEITGHIGRVKSFDFGGQTFTDVPTIFPDQSAGTAGIGGRQGNLGSGILRRFKVIYDYSRKQMIVEPNKFTRDSFETRMSNNSAVSAVQVLADGLQEYIGNYGDRTVVVESGAFYIQRPGGRKLKLVPTAKDEFTLEEIPVARIKFVRDVTGKVTEIQVLNQQGQWENSKKDSPKPKALPGSQLNNQSQNEKSLSQDELEVRKLEQEWLDAYEKRDAEAMNRILADDFKLTFPSGSVQTKADVLAQIRSAREAGRPSPKLSTEDVQSRVQGETVTLSGRFIQLTKRDGQTRMMQLRYTDTYAKRQGRWQIVASL